MTSKAFRKVKKGINNLPNLLYGYNLHVNRNKLRLIDRTFRDFCPEASSFADLGGVWNVNAAYTVHTLKRYKIERAVLVDTDYPQILKERLGRFPQLTMLEGDFGTADAVRTVGSVDVIYFFDVLLHQANPDWDEVLDAYARNSSCIVIYNQQFIYGSDAVRLTELPLENYIELTSDFRRDFYKYVYDHKYELHPRYQKPWGDIHNIIQWGITDSALRSTMTSLGFKEMYFHSFGRFIDIPALEDHAFVFRKG